MLALTLFRVGLARSTLSALTPGFSVELFDSGLVSLGVFPVNTLPLVTFSEAQFSHLGVPVRRAAVDFFAETAATRFALDNLTFDTPEPASLLLMGAGLVAAVGYGRRRSRGR